jgi:hypothetical protein
MPMDETLAVVAVDLGGRPHAVVDLKVRVRLVGDLQSELVHDFFEGFAIGARANVHVKVLYGRSSHHHVEAVFKAFARALRVACARTRGWRRCCRAPRGCCDRAHRLRRRQPHVGAQGARRPRRRGSRRRIAADSPRASGLIVPGVGHFAATRRSTPRGATRSGGACEAGTPLLGICLGMQWLFEGSDEAPDVPGLGVLLPGASSRLAATRAPAEGAARRLERARDRAAVAAARGVPGAQVYFTHSYAAPVTADAPWP